jgi:pimeloyl-ACP methyl ester carboxylesterase
MTAFPAFGPDAKTHRITTRTGVTMRVVEEGKGPDVIFIPGGDSPAEAYAHLFHLLTPHFRCLSYDPRGVGETSSPPAPWSIEEMGADCAAIIETLCDGPAIVSGLSMGGLVTQATAIDFPHLVRLAIPMGTAAYIDGFTRNWMEAEIRLRREGVALPDYFLAVHYAAYAYPAKALHDPALWAQVKEAYTARFAGRCPQDLIDQWQACLDYDCRARLPDCPVPFHVIAFSEDVQTAPSMCKLVADLARRGTFHEIPELGHVSLLRHRPEIVAAKLKEIIAGEIA